MGLAEDAETIKEYIQWKATRQDQSPEAFVLDRAKQGAYERLEEVISWMHGYLEDDDGKLDFVAGVEAMEAVDLETIMNMLEGN
jgi:hypothetical protein